MVVYNLGNRIVNTYLYPIEQGYVLIDTGYEDGYRRFLNNFKKINVSLKEIRYLFLTHAHDDHAGFLCELLWNAPWIKVIMHTGAKEILTKGQNSFEGGCAGRFAYIFCQIMKLFGKGQHRFPPITDRLFEQFLEITDDNIEELENILQGKIIETPGHTQDSISLLLNEGILFCGDAAMNGIPSMKRITIWIESKSQYKSSWNKIISLKPQLIYSGHGKPFAVKDLKQNILLIDNRKLYRL